jgi:uncharacterized protein (DUF169 family)
MVVLSAGCGFSPGRCETDYAGCTSACADGKMEVCAKALEIAKGVCDGNREHEAFRGRTGKVLACARVKTLTERMAADVAK